MMLTYATHMRGLLADHDTPTGLIWERWGESLARGSARRPWIIIGAWVLALVLFIASAATLLGDALAFEFKLANDSDSVVADKLIEERHTGPQRTNEIIIVSSQSITVDDVAFKRKVESTFESVTSLGDEIVESGVHYYLTGDNRWSPQTAALPSSPSPWQAIPPMPPRI